MSAALSVARQPTAQPSFRRRESQRVIKNTSIVLFTLLISLSGCAQDYRLDPPGDSEQMTITVKVPEALEVETLHVDERVERTDPTLGIITR